MKITSEISFSFTFLFLGLITVQCISAALIIEARPIWI